MCFIGEVCFQNISFAIAHSVISGTKTLYTYWYQFSMPCCPKSKSMIKPVNTKFATHLKIKKAMGLCTINVTLPCVMTYSTYMTMSKQRVGWALIYSAFYITSDLITKSFCHNDFAIK